MPHSSHIVRLTSALNDFNPVKRREALLELLGLAEQGAITLPEPANVANMHCHTFFSFNAFGYSPTALAWLARERGYKLMGIVDFDVLDAVDEFLDACELAGVRASAGIETRVFVPEFASREINSPGEPGIDYHMGIGFTSGDIPAGVAGIAGGMRRRAAQRNRGVVERVNAHLAPVSVDYEADVLPLTPCGNATERHIVQAYVRAAERLAPDPALFWAEKLGMEAQKTAALMTNSAAFQNTVRNKLIKKGGVGYVQPTRENFPTVEEFHEFILAAGALPCAAWLDGLSDGEQAIGELLELLIGKGVVCLNIIPDRNWDLPDPDLRRKKVAELYEVVELAARLDLPLNVGTEMNAFGQKLVDDFAAPELAPVRQAFLDGAHFIYGHTFLHRAAGLGYQSEWARRLLPTRSERNHFYTKAGYAAQPGKRFIAGLQAALHQREQEVQNQTLTPDDVLKTIQENRH